MFEYKFFTNSKFLLLSLFGTSAIIYYLNSRRKRLLSSNLSKKDIIGLLERRVQKGEEGKNASILVNYLFAGQLYNAAESLLNTRSILIVTGYPCTIDVSPPTGTNGPMGAISIAKCLQALGKSVTLMTDESNEVVVSACATASNLVNIKFESLPSRTRFSASDHYRLTELAKTVDCVIFVDRPGPSPDGSYRTLKGIEIDHLVAPFEMILPMASPSGTPQGSEKVTSSSASTSPPTSAKILPSIGIGNHKNVIGMGKIYDTIVQGNALPLTRQIVCVVPTEHLLMATLVDWGAFALTAALAVLSAPAMKPETASADPIQSHAVVFASLEESLSACLPTPEELHRMLTRMVAAGARDSVTDLLEPTLEGLPLSSSVRVLEDLRAICTGRGRSSRS